MITCQYKNHEVKPISMYHYWDEENGIGGKGIDVCRECYAEHILKFYPDGRIAEYIRNNPDNFKNTD
jgi:hypothetical protein